MQVGIEDVARLWIDFADAMSLHLGQHGAFSHRNAIDQILHRLGGIGDGVLVHRSDGARQTVRDVEHVFGEFGDGIFARIADFLLGPLAGVVGLGDGAQQPVARRFQLGIQLENDIVAAGGDILGGVIFLGRVVGHDVLILNIERRAVGRVSHASSLSRSGAVQNLADDAGCIIDQGDNTRIVQTGGANYTQRADNLLVPVHIGSHDHT